MQKERILEFIAVAFKTVSNNDLRKKLIMDFLKEELPDELGKAVNIRFNKLMEITPGLGKAEGALIFPWQRLPTGEFVKVVDLQHPERNGRYLMINLPDHPGPDFKKDAADLIIRTLENIDRHYTAQTMPKKRPDPGPQVGATGPNSDGSFPKPAEMNLPFFEAWKLLQMGNSIARAPWPFGKVLALRNREPHMIPGPALMPEKIISVEVASMQANDWYIVK